MERIVKKIFGVLLLAAVLLAAGCELFPDLEAPAETGSLSIAFGEGGGPSGGRAVSPEILSTLRYDLTLTGPDNETITVSLTAGESFSQEVQLGGWHIEAKAYTPDGALFGAGSTTVTIKPGHNPVRIPMTEVGTAGEGGGEYSISLNVSGNYIFPSATVGYATAPAAQTVTVTNTGNQATGTLAVALSGYDSSSFTLGGTSISNIAVGGNATFTVVPNTDLAVGTYTATVTVSGDNSITASFTVRFTVNPLTPTYGIGLSHTSTHTFPAANFGYTTPTAETITVTNTGNRPTGALNVTLGGASHGSFTLTDASITDIAVGGSATFTVVPQTGLAVGTHAATVTVSGGNGISASFGVSFTVNAQTVSDVNLTSHVTAPITGVSSATELTGSHPQYDGDITWKNAADDSGHSGAFLASTVYKAIVTLTANSGYTFTGVGADTFTYTGAATVTNAADSGVVTITFPPTAPVPSNNIRYVTSGGAGDKGGSSWANASDDLQAMIDEVYSSTNPGEKIVRVAAGTYKPKYKPGSSGNSVSAPNDFDCTFILRQGVQIRGGYAAGESITEETRQARFNTEGMVINAAHKTILSGDIREEGDPDDNTYHVVLAVGISASNPAVLDGFTITGGKATGGGPDLAITIDGTSYSIPKLNGGGVCNWKSSPLLKNVTITNNHAGTPSAGTGGGMYNFQSSPILTAVTISNNTASMAGGGMYNYDQSLPVLTDVTISGNRADAGSFGTGQGGGIYNGNNSNPTLLRVKIIENTASNTGNTVSDRGNGGGMYNSSSSPKLINVIISGNTATRSGSGSDAGAGGGIYNTSSSPKLINVLISGNRANNSGGGIYNEDAYSSPELINVTIAGNYAPYGGAITPNIGSTTTIKNSIIWGNSSGINTAGGGTVTISHSLVQGESSTGNSNLDGTVSGNDPKFVTLATATSTNATTGGDYHLQSSSPVINEGDDDSYTTARGIPAGNFTGEKDLGGASRKSGSAIDMGAYEYQ